MGRGMEFVPQHLSLKIVAHILDILTGMGILSDPTYVLIT